MSRTETLEEYLARSGTIKKLPTKPMKREPDDDILTVNTSETASPGAYIGGESIEDAIISVIDHFKKKRRKRRRSKN